MSLVRSAFPWNWALGALKPGRSRGHGHPLFLGDSRRLFSSELPPPPPQQNPSLDPLFQETGDGLVFGSLVGASRHTLKSDIMGLLEGCNLTPDNIRFRYTRHFMPVELMIQFQSRQEYENAARTVLRKGRLFKLERADRSKWENTRQYNGKTVLMEGIPRNATLQDVEHFLSGCEYDTSNMQIFVRQGPAGTENPIRCALVQFPSSTQAMMACIRKNKGFCLNNEISMRVIQ